MPSSIISPAVADQENVPLPQNASIEDVAASVRSAAVDAMAGQVDGSTKNSNKRKFCPRMDDPKKIEALFRKFDSAGLLFNLADDAKRYVGSSGSNSSPNSLVSVIEVLEFIALEGKQLLKEMRAMVDNTKAKSRAAQSHNKIKKHAIQL